MSFLRYSIPWTWCWCWHRCWILRGSTYTTPFRGWLGLCEACSVLRLMVKSPYFCNKCRQYFFQIKIILGLLVPFRLRISWQLVWRSTKMVWESCSWHLSISDRLIVMVGVVFPSNFTYHSLVPSGSSTSGQWAWRSVMRSWKCK